MQFILSINLSVHHIKLISPRSIVSLDTFVVLLTKGCFIHHPHHWASQHTQMLTGRDVLILIDRPLVGVCSLATLRFCRNVKSKLLFQNHRRRQNIDQCHRQAATSFSFGVSSENLVFFLKGPTSLYADNTSAIWIAKNAVFHERTKPIEVDYHFIRQHVELVRFNFPMSPLNISWLIFLQKLYQSFNLTI